MKTRILLVDDRRIVREGLRALIQKEDGMEVVAEAEDGRAALQLASTLAPDVVVMDVTIPNLNGIDATRKIIAENPNVRVVALSIHSDRRFITGMLDAGASGYVLKDCAFEELTRAIRAAVANKTYLSPEIANIVVENYVTSVAKTGSSGVPAPVLTAREREVLQLLAEGNNMKQVASCLHVSVKTVETHRRAIMEKLDIYSMAGLTKYAIREGLTTAES